MPLTRIVPYRPPRSTIRELMEGRPAGADDEGIPPKGVPGETAQVGLQEGGQGAGGETREGALDKALARRGTGERTQCRRAAVRGRARDRRREKGKGEKGDGVEWSGGFAREGRPPGLAWDCQGERPAGARGPETRTEGSLNPMNCAVVTCLGGG